MYEMEGALPGFAAPDRPVAWPPRGRARRSAQVPVRSTGFPVLLTSRSYPRSYPRMVPVSNGESISTASASVAQESTGIHFHVFLRPQVVHETRTVIRPLPRLSTGLHTTRPQGAGDKLESVGRPLPDVIVKYFTGHFLLTCFSRWSRTWLWSTGNAGRNRRTGHDGRFRQIT